jgi:carbon-monoxide dehydrogenase medium subunit
MRTAAFDYHRAETVAEALTLLQDTEGAKLLAGGHSLVPAMKLRVASPAALIDITRIPGLADIAPAKDGLAVGALATHEAVARSELVRSTCPLLAETAGQIGDPQVRARGTLGGSIAHADPAADYPTTLLALGAAIHVTGADGDRTIDAGDCFVDFFETSVGEAELITSVTVPALGPSTGAVYLKNRHPASDYAVVGVTAIVTMGDETISEATLAIGGVVGKPVLVPGVGEALAGREPTAEAFASAAALVPAALPNPIGDLYASGEYRVHLAGVMAKRALAAAAGRAA